MNECLFQRFNIFMFQSSLLMRSHLEISSWLLNMTSHKKSNIFTFYEKIPWLIMISQLTFMSWDHFIILTRSNGNSRNPVISRMLIEFSVFWKTEFFFIFLIFNKIVFGQFSHFWAVFHSQDLFASSHKNRAI